MKLFLATLLIMSCVATLPAQALASVIPISPIAGAELTTTHPTYTWNRNGNEINILSISSGSRTTTEGEFYDEDKVDSYFPDSAASSYSDSTPLPADSYFWNLSWNAPDYSESGYTTPASFTVLADVHQAHLRIRQWSSISDLDINASWWSNTSSVRLTCRLFRKGKIVRMSSSEPTDLNIGSTNRETCTLHVPERWDGRRLKAMISVSSGSVSSSKTVSFRAR